jgi:hypothetical protein
MMMKRYFNNYVAGLLVSCGIAAALTACDKLDEVPDNRSELNNVEKVQQLLVSAYPAGLPNVICELSGDNLVDNNVVVPATHYDAYSPWNEEAYKWLDITNYSTGEQDTPYQTWEGCYQGIATANHAIEAMEHLSSDPKNDPDYSHSWGEAHMLRAWLHFTLLNVFAEAYKDDTKSEQDMGIPYVTEPETVVNVDYSSPKYRKSVAECYRLIEKDILEGIDLIDDSKYKVPAYHFNKNAAHALAARFYLFWRKYDKCIEHANAALGSNPASMLRKWSSLNTNTMDTRLNDFNDEKAACNFLIVPTNSIQDRIMSACRYCINNGKTSDDGDLTKNIDGTDKILYNGGGPNWTGYIPAYAGNLFIWGDQDYGLWLFRVYEYFEYTDKIAGIGYVHILYQPFTAEETLLCRAEAKLFTGDREGAINDLGYWTAAKMVEKPLDQAGIDAKYGGVPTQCEPNCSNNYDAAAGQNMFISDLHMQDISSEFKTLTDQEMRVLHCILHFRRIENMYEGLRWFDIKRFGITVHHAYRGPQEDEIHHDWLRWNDQRRVLQIPSNVINAGYPSTDRGEPYTVNQDSYITKPAYATYQIK